LLLRAKLWLRTELRLRTELLLRTKLRLWLRFGLLRWRLWPVGQPLLHVPWQWLRRMLRSELLLRTKLWLRTELLLRAKLRLRMWFELLRWWLWPVGSPLLHVPWQQLRLLRAELLLRQLW
jgi:hypothetical protein